MNCLLLSQIFVCGNQLEIIIHVKLQARRHIACDVGTVTMKSMCTENYAQNWRCMWSSHQRSSEKNVSYYVYSGHNEISTSRKISSN
jgi:hypothetical protein